MEEKVPDVLSVYSTSVHRQEKSRPYCSSTSLSGVRACHELWCLVCLVSCVFAPDSDLLPLNSTNRQSAGLACQFGGWSRAPTGFWLAAIDICFGARGNVCVDVGTE